MEKNGYLFTYFMDEKENGEKVYFATSKDGLFWEEENGGAPVLISNIGTGGVRDPFPIYDPESKKYYIIATDLKIGTEGNWKTARMRGSRSFLVWESEDLEHWSEARLSEMNIPDGGCIWAPEAIYDEEKGQFFVFFSVWVGNPVTEEGKHKIYACYTKEFKKFTEPFVYIEREEDVIDTTIVKEGDRYFRISKNETTKKLILEEGGSLTGKFVEIESDVLNQLSGIEGPECYPLLDGRWCLIADAYQEGTGYFPMVTETLHDGKFRVLDSKEYSMGKAKKRHGGVLCMKSKRDKRR